MKLIKAAALFFVPSNGADCYITHEANGELQEIEWSDSYHLASASCQRHIIRAEDDKWIKLRFKKWFGSNYEQPATTETEDGQKQPECTTDYVGVVWGDRKCDGPGHFHDPNPTHDDVYCKDYAPSRFQGCPVEDWGALGKLDCRVIPSNEMVEHKLCHRAQYSHHTDIEMIVPRNEAELNYIGQPSHGVYANFRGMIVEYSELEPSEVRETKEEGSIELDEDYAPAQHFQQIIAPEAVDKIQVYFESYDVQSYVTDVGNDLIIQGDFYFDTDKDEFSSSSRRVFGGHHQYEQGDLVGEFEGNVVNFMLITNRWIHYGGNGLVSDLPSAKYKFSWKGITTTTSTKKDPSIDDEIIDADDVEF